jgi:hypothetical protein
MSFWAEAKDAWFGPADLRSALARMRGARAAANRLDAALDALRIRPSNATARRVVETEALWSEAFFDRFYEEVQRAGSRGVRLEPYRALLDEGARYVGHARAFAAPRAAVMWIEAAQRVDNIGLAEAERLLRGFGQAALADRVRDDMAAVKALGHSGPIRERAAKGIPLPAPTVWSARQAV